VDSANLPWARSKAEATRPEINHLALWARALVLGREPTGAATAIPASHTDAFKLVW